MAYDLHNREISAAGGGENEPDEAGGATHSVKARAPK